MKQVNIYRLPYDQFMAIVGSAADGLHKLEAPLGLTHITEVPFRAQVDVINKKNKDYQNAKTLSAESKKALDEAFQEALTFTLATRDLLKPKLGRTYSRVWDEVGFINKSLRVKQTVPGVLSVAKAMELFFESRPELEVAGVATSALAGGIYDALRAAYTAMEANRSDMRQKKKARDDAASEMRVDMVTLRRELSMVLADNDPRWLEFGFNVPGDVTVAQAPENLTVVPGLAGKALLAWEPPVNSDRFHIYKKIVGTDETFVRVATVTEATEELDALPTGAHMQFYVTAVNAAGESQPSQTVEIVVP